MLHREGIHEDIRAFLDEGQTEEQHAQREQHGEKPEQRFVFAQQKHGQRTDGDDGQREKEDIELKAEGGDNPAGHGGAEVGAENDGKRVPERNDAGFHKGEHNQRYDGAALRDGGQHRADGDGLEQVLRVPADKQLQRATRHLLQDVFQLPHAVNKQAQACQKFPDFSVHVWVGFSDRVVREYRAAIVIPLC